MKSNSPANLLICISIAHLAVSAFGATLNHKISKHEHAHGHSVLVDPLHKNQLNAKHYRSLWSIPTSDIVSYGTKLHFTVNVTDLASDCFQSSTFRLNKLDWIIKFCKVSGKTNNRVEDALDGTLIYANSMSFDESLTLWSIDALAVFQLAITNEKIDGKIMKKLKHTYNNEASQHSVELIDWSALMANCVDDDKFTVDVEVMVGPKSNLAIDMAQVAADFRVFVDDVSELGATTSPQVFLQGAGWQVDINIDGENVSVHLLRSKCDYTDTLLCDGLNENEWSWNVTMSLSLLPVNHDAQPITKQFTHVFNMDKSWGYPNFVSYANFTKSYVQNDKATFVVNLKVDSPQPLWKIDDEMNNLNQLF